MSHAHIHVECCDLDPFCVYCGRYLGPEENRLVIALSWIAVPFILVFLLFGFAVGMACERIERWRLASR